MNNVYQIITDKFVNALEKGEVVWQKPWGNTSVPFISYTTGKPYSFLNTMLLMMQGGTDGEYLTFKQIKEKGGKVKKGAKQKMVVFSCRDTYTKTEENENGEEVEKECVRFILRYYNVFHISETEGIEAKHPVTEAKHINQPLEEAENVIREYIKAEGIIYDDSESDNAFFSPSMDMVRVPNINQYEIVEEFYSTTFHELVHSTGVEKRCNRGLEKQVAFGSEKYSKEELIAEIGSAMLVNILGVDCEKAFNNSVAYVQSWLKKLKNDPKLIVIASAKAEQAVKYILNEK